MNSPVIQNAIVAYLNKNYLESKKLKLRVGTFGLNPFTGGININDIEVTQTIPQSKFKLKLSQASIVFHLISTYVTKKPVIKKIMLRGLSSELSYDQNGRINLPDFFSKNKINQQKQSQEINIPKELNDFLPFLPEETLILNAKLKLGDSEKSNYQKVTLAYLDLKKDTHFLSEPTVEMKILFNDSVLRFPWLHGDTNIQKVHIVSELSKGEKFDFQKIEIESNLLKADFLGSVDFKKRLQNTKYQFSLKKVEIFDKSFFQLLDLKSAGVIALSGKLNSQDDLFKIPHFLGKVQWKDVCLEGFDIYSGHADLLLKDKTVFYSKGQIETPHGGHVNAAGKYELFDAFHFENIVSVEKMPFAELLAGLGVAGSPVDFRIASKQMSVTGNILSKNKKNMFDLVAVGQGLVNEFLVTDFDQKGRPTFPEVHFDLNLAANARGIALDKTSAFLGSEQQLGRVNVDRGSIDFSSKQNVSTSINVSGKGIDLSLAQYFLKMKSFGKADFDGQIIASTAKKEFAFRANSSVQKGMLFGMHFEKLEGEWGLNLNEIWMKNGKVMFHGAEGSPSQTIANVEELHVEYKDLKSDIQANLTGNVHDIVSSFSQEIPENGAQSFGNIEKMHVHLKGPLLDPFQWTLKSNVRATDLGIMDARIGLVDIGLNCLQGICSDSYFHLSKVANQAKAKNAKGFLFSEINRLSKQDAQFKIRIYDIPLALFQRVSQQPLDGMASGQANLSGTWNQITGSAWLDIRDFAIGHFSFGNVQAQFRPSVDDLKIFTHAFDDQMQLDFSFPKAENKPATLALHLLKFNPTVFLDERVRSQNNLFAQLTGDFLFHGPSPLFHQTSENSLTKWSGLGRFQTGMLQWGGVLLDLNEVGDIQLSNGKVSVKSIDFVGESGKIRFGGMYQIKNDSLDLLTTMHLNLDTVHRGFSLFGPSKGKILGQIKIQGGISDPKFFGQVEMDAQTLLLNSSSPAFQNVHGKLKFHDKKIDIVSLTAKKGGGSVRADGWVSFEKWFKGDSSSPALHINAMADNADVKLAVPSLQTVDLSLSSHLSLEGDQAPYLMSGRVDIDKLHVFREVTCSQLSTELSSRPKNYQSFVNKPTVLFNIGFHAAGSIQIQTKCIAGKFSTNPTLFLVGDNITPLLSGGIMSDRSRLFVLKSRFNVRKAEIQFVETQKYDPNVDIQMEARYPPAYTLYWNMYGRLSQAKLDLSVTPPTLVNGDRIIQADLISAISTGQMPLESSSANLLTASAGAASFLGINNIFETTLNDAVQNVTGGLVDSVSIVPTTQSGQLSWRATARKSVATRLDLGISYESGSMSTIQSSYGNYMFNDTVSAVGSYSYATYFQQPSTQEFFSGLRFNFGTQ